MNISSPALKAGGHARFEQPSTCPWPFQSPTTKPSKLIRPTSTSVSIAWLPCIFLPWKLLNDAITVCTPARIAGA